MSEDLLVDGYDYNPHTCMVEVPYNDYWDMKNKCKENKQLKDQLQQKENIIKEVREYLDFIKEKQKVVGVYTKDVHKHILEILDKEDKQ